MDLNGQGALALSDTIPPTWTGCVLLSLYDSSLPHLHHFSMRTPYSSPVTQPKNNPRKIETSGIPLQMRVSSGSVFGFPAMYHTTRPRNIPGMNMTPPMISVLRVRITIPTIDDSRRCVLFFLRKQNVKFRNGSCVQHIMSFKPTFSASHHTVRNIR